jgi:hypothetical protein
MAALVKMRQPNLILFNEKINEFIRETKQSHIKLSVCSNLNYINSRCNDILKLLMPHIPEFDLFSTDVNFIEYHDFIDIYSMIDDEFKNSIYFWILICSKFNGNACLHEKCIEVVSLVTTTNTDTDGLIKWLVLYGSLIVEQQYRPFLNGLLDSDLYKISIEDDVYVEFSLIEYALFSKQRYKNSNLLFNLIPSKERTLRMYTIIAWRNPFYVSKPESTNDHYHKCDYSDDDSKRIHIPEEIRQNEKFKEAYKYGDNLTRLPIDFFN